MTTTLWKSIGKVMNRLCLLVLIAIVSPMFVSAQTLAPDNVARIGVLAFRGAGSAESQWQPLAAYLSGAVNGWRFEVVPVTLVSALDEIKSNGLEFLITNPGHYVTLAEQFGLGVLATRERRAQVSGAGLLRYGTVIFSRQDSGIQILDDLKGKRLAAVSPDAFGGFQLAWQEMVNQGVDPLTDIGAIRFMGFPQDAIVAEVLAGNVEAGVIRSGLLESLAAEGRIDISDLVVLQNNSQMAYPYMVSGRLYPEWPFTALPGIDKHLREAVVVALLDTQQPSAVEAFALKDIWSAPLSYDEVRTLNAAYRDANMDGKDSYSTYLYLITITLMILLIWISWQIMWRRKPIARPELEDVTSEDAPEIADIKSRFQSLTKRELEVLSMICTGNPSREIAKTLGISPKTVEYHRANLLQKTAAGTTAHLVQLATRFGYDLGFSLGK